MQSRFYVDSLVHRLLVDARQLRAEVTEFGPFRRSDVSVEFIFDAECGQIVEAGGKFWKIMFESNIFLCQSMAYR